MKDQAPVSQDVGNPEQAQQHTAASSSSHNSRTHSHTRRALPPDISREEAALRLGTFQRLARLLAQSENSVDRIVEAAARLVSDAIGDMCVVTLLNTHSETYHIAAYHDPDPEVVSLYERTLTDVENIPSDQGWVASVIRTGQPLLMPAISLEQALARAVPSFAEFTRRVGIASILIVPIMGRSGTLGAMALTRHHGGRSYDESNQQFLMELAYRVGLAIENAMLIESLRGELAARHLAKEALAASEQRFLSIFHASVLGIKIMDLVGSILETNAAFQAMTGYSETELVGAHFYDFVHPDDVERVKDAFTTLKSNQLPEAAVEHRLLRRDGTISWISTTLAAVKKGPQDPTIALIFGIAQDITGRKRADAELLELRQHLERSIEMERLRLAQNLHDTPLQELYAAIYKLEELRPTTRPATAETIGQVIDDIKHTLAGLRQTASELRPPSLSRFGLEKAIRSYVEDFRQKYPALHLELALARDRQLLSEDTRLVLFRVFQEAMANVTRHSHATEVKVRFAFDAEEARLEVSDNGRGFEVPGNWMSNVRAGHYGLAGMAERVSAAGGTLTLESTPDGPTTIRAVVPC